MNLQVTKIIFFWGVLLFIFQTVISAFFQFFGIALFAWDSAYYLAIPFGWASDYFAGYKSTKSIYKITGSEKAKSLIWYGFYVGLIAMVLDMVGGYLLTGQFKIGGILVPVVTAFGAKLATPKKR